MGCSPQSLRRICANVQGVSLEAEVLLRDSARVADMSSCVRFSATKLMALKLERSSNNQVYRFPSSPSRCSWHPLVQESTPYLGKCAPIFSAAMDRTALRTCRI